MFLLFFFLQIGEQEDGTGSLEREGVGIYERGEVVEKGAGG
jgi:hypothetical protein